MSGTAAIYYLALIIIGVTAYCFGRADERDAQAKADAKRRRVDRIVSTIEEAGRMTP